MGTFALEIWYDEGKMCSFYSVSLDVENDDESTETDKFFDMYAQKGGRFRNHAIQLSTLILNDIGNRYGATEDFTNRYENNALALPPILNKKNTKIKTVELIGRNFPLRLFCYVISEQLVVLFNGGVKDAGTAQESQLSLKFQEAQTYVNRIEQALREGDIEISSDGRSLISFDGSDNIIL